MRTLDSPISSRPTRWSMATRFTPGQRPRMPSPISRIFASAIGACASYSRNFTGRPPVSYRTTPEKMTMPPAPGSSIVAAIASGESGAVTTRYVSPPAPPLTGGKRQSSSSGRRRCSAATYSLPTANNVNGRYRASSGWRSATADHADSTVPPSGRSSSIRSRPVASRYRANRRTRTRTVGAASRAGETRRAVPVDVDLDAVRLDDVVVRLLQVLPAELVGHAGAPTADDADPEPPLGLALLEAQLRDLLRGGFSHRDHSILQNWRAFR